MIANGIKAEIFTKHLASDTMFPSIRWYAEVYCANPNTVTRAFHSLWAEAIIYADRTIGYCVATDIEMKRLSAYQ